MSSESKVYLVRAGKSGEDEDFVLEHSTLMIGFTDVPSLASASDYESVFKIVDTAMPGAKPRAVGNRASQLWAFRVAMKEGDLVVMPTKSTAQIAIGRVSGPYAYATIGGTGRHTRKVTWLRTDVPRTVFGRDLLNSFGAFMTVCNISRNNAEARVAAVVAGQQDPGHTPVANSAGAPVAAPVVEAEEVPDLALQAHDQVVAHIQRNFRGHDLAGLVDAVLRADGWVTKLSPPGPDGGVDILGGRGPLGLDAPRLCVQVKSSTTPADVTIYRTLQGTMQTFKAEQGLLVCWGGFNKVVQAEARQGHFAVRLWDSRDLVEAIYRTYELLPAEIQAELPLKRVWMLVPDEDEA